MFITLGIAIALFICFLLSFKYYKGDKYYNLRFILIMLSFIIGLVTFVLYSFHQDNIKQHIQKEKLVKIFKNKTKNPGDKAYLYGLSLVSSKNIDQTIIKCYSKFHSFKKTKICISGVIWITLDKLKF